MRHQTHTLLLAAITLLSLSCARAIGPRPRGQLQPELLREVMLLGGSGTVGDGILEALLRDRRVRTIVVVTRRITTRMKRGVKQGKVQLVLHRNYLDYSPLVPYLARIRTVYWALGVSTFTVDRKRYTQIHVHFPIAFVRLWIAQLRARQGASFHLISSARVSPGSWWHWARAKARAEASLTGLVHGSGIRTILYRPEYVKGTSARATLFSHIIYPFAYVTFGAVRALHIGQAIIEATTRASELSNGTVLENRSIHLFAAHYRRR